MNGLNRMCQWTLTLVSGMNATGDPAFSMFNLSLKEEWMNNRKFCHRLSDDEVLNVFVVATARVWAPRQSQ